MRRLLAVVSILVVVTVGSVVFRSVRSGAGPAQRPGWSRLLLGRPSGVQPLSGPRTTEPELSRPINLPARHSPAPRAAPVDSPADLGPVFQVTVRAGDTLGELCQGFYGTARPSLVAAVARFNGLPGPDRIREGQVLRLPPRESLE